MKAMLLAAGSGTRLRPLTDTVPKPLVTIGGESLIERHIRRLCRAGFNEVVINVSYLREQMMHTLGDGSRYGIRIQWSDEGQTMLGTGGGIYYARDLLADDPWLVINADVYTDWEPETLSLPGDAIAHLLLVDNPQHCAGGDYCLEQSQVSLDGLRKLTFAGIGCYRRQLFEAISGPVFQLPKVLNLAIRKGRVRGTHYRGFWADAGTIDSLHALRAQFG